MPVTVTVNDGKGGTGSDTVTVQVVRPTPKAYTFEDVHFDFDRHSLRPEATRVLDEAVNALREDSTLRVTIEGHTCNIGTAEYNSRSAIGALLPCATTWSAAAYRRTGCRRSATVRSDRSTTTRAKKRAG